MKMTGLLAAGVLAALAYTTPSHQGYQAQPPSSGPKNGKTARRAKQKMAKATRQKNRGKK